MVLDFAKEAIENTDSHSINFDELKAGKANIKVIGCGGCGGNMVTDMSVMRRLRGPSAWALSYICCCGGL